MPQQIDLAWRAEYDAFLAQLEAQKDRLSFGSFRAVALVILRRLRNGETLTYDSVIDQVSVDFAPSNGWESNGGFDRRPYVSHFVPMAVEALRNGDVIQALTRLH